MKIVGFNFKKINVENFSDSFKNLKINTNLDILEMAKMDVKLLNDKEQVIGVKFKYLINYEPSIAKIDLEGVILISVEVNIAKEVLKQWKDKKILEEIKIPLFNTIIKKSTIKALQLQDEMNLPNHIPLPSLKKSETENNN